MDALKDPIYLIGLISSERIESEIDRIEQEMLILANQLEAYRTLRVLRTVKPKEEAPSARTTSAEAVLKVLSERPHGMSIAQIAEETSIPRGTVNHIVNGGDPRIVRLSRGIYALKNSLAG